MMQKYSVYLPCRAGSERIINKNTKEFYNGKSLLEYKLDKLSQIENVAEICVSTDDDTVKHQIESGSYKKVQIHQREHKLCQSNTKTEDLISDMLKICKCEAIIWTHVTSPHLRNETVEMAINIFEKNKSHDSLMTVNKIQNFVWMNGKSVNYNRTENKWPNTQTLKPVYEINSGLFIIEKNLANRYQDRIGNNPYLFETTYPENIDIDWPDDFKRAQEVLLSR